jgi:hypothetical protein
MRFFLPLDLRTTEIKKVSNYETMSCCRTTTGDKNIIFHVNKASLAAALSAVYTKKNFLVGRVTKIEKF